MSEKRAINAHAWEQEANEHYVEPAWIGRRLFQVERFIGEVCDPCCGFGNMMEGARAADLPIRPFDLVKRGYVEQWGVRDFLKSRQTFSNFAFNPPFGLLREFTEHAMRLAERKVAVVAPLRRMPAAGEWLQRLPLARTYYLTPRPSMPPGPVYADLQASGREASGGQQDFVVLILIKNFEGEPVTRWLHRDGDVE